MGSLTTRRSFDGGPLLIVVVAFLGFLAVQGAVAGERTGRQQVSANPLAACLAACRDVDCLRKCNTTYFSDAALASAQVKPMSRAAAAEADVSLSECLQTGLDDVLTCSQVFADADDPDGYWICVGAATGKFIKCTGWLESESSDVRTMVLHRFSLDLLLNVAASPGGRTRSGRVEVTYDGKHVVIKRTGDRGDESSVEQAAASFGECARAFRDNRQTCRNLFPNDPEALDVCLDGTVTVFQNCVGGLEA